MQALGLKKKNNFEEEKLIAVAGREPEPISSPINSGMLLYTYKQTFHVYIKM